MTIKLKSGVALSIDSVYGPSHDDIYFEAHYVESTDDITDAHIDEVYAEHYNELYEAWVDVQAAHADLIYDHWKHGDYDPSN